jgi:vacuolar-type H+-ATPase subunit B/Vma2
VLTRFEKNAKWRPKRISEGQAVLGVLNNAVGIRRDPSFVLPVLTNLSKSAIAIKSKRGDADNTAEQIIQIVESLNN